MELIRETDLLVVYTTYASVTRGKGIYRTPRYTVIVCSCLSEENIFKLLRVTSQKRVVFESRLYPLLKLCYGLCRSLQVVMQGSVTCAGGGQNRLSQQVLPDSVWRNFFYLTWCIGNGNRYGRVSLNKAVANKLLKISQHSFIFPVFWKHWTSLLPKGNQYCLEVVCEEKVRQRELLFFILHKIRILSFSSLKKNKGRKKSMKLLRQYFYQWASQNSETQES